MKIVLATRNPGKLVELRALLGQKEIEVLSSGQNGDVPEVVEDGRTLEENALKKARALARLSQLPSLADDTGLEVAALNGKPGVHSSRFAGPDANDAENRRKLLAALEQVSDRSARFRTVLAYVDGGEVHYFDGTCEGRIARTERGSHGFGYDSIFIPTGSDHTFAQMTPFEKNAVSHRARALRAFTAFLDARLDI